MVCLGNTARSPIAEYLARYYAQKNELNLTIQSAGFFNAFSYMQPESEEYLQTKGIDTSDFKPQLITHSLLEQQDLILTMETSHKQDILKNFKEIKNLEKKIFTLKEFNGENDDLDIIDPYYTSHSTYIKVLKVIDENVEAVIKKLKIINRGTSY
ncbi:MAG: hypothetical protein ACFE9R_05250 [Candidatus Hermodarchaeota archaeon]